MPARFQGLRGDYLEDSPHQLLCNLAKTERVTCDNRSFDEVVVGVHDEFPIVTKETGHIFFDLSSRLLFELLRCICVGAIDTTINRIASYLDIIPSLRSCSSQRQSLDLHWLERLIRRPTRTVRTFPHWRLEMQKNWLKCPTLQAKRLQQLVRRRVERRPVKRMRP